MSVAMSVVTIKRFSKWVCNNVVTRGLKLTDLVKLQKCFC